MSNAVNVFQTEAHGNVLVIIPVDQQSGLRNLSRLQEQTDQIAGSIEQGDVVSVLVDAENLPFLPSRLISAFIQLWEASLEHGGRFAICNLSDEAMQSLIVTRLDTRWPTFDSREAALAEFAG